MNTTYGIINFRFNLKCRSTLLGKTFETIIGGINCKVLFPSCNEFTSIIEEVKTLPLNKPINITDSKLSTLIQLTAPKIIEQDEISKIEWGEIQNLKSGTVSVNKALLIIDNNTENQDWEIFYRDFT
jgi:hypothetical protein